MNTDELWFSENNNFILEEDFSVGYADSQDQCPTNVQEDLYLYEDDLYEAT